MKVIIYSTKNFERKYLSASNTDKHTVLMEPEALSVKTADLAKGFDAVSIFSNDDASAPVLEKLKAAGVKYIAIRAAGYDQTDLAKAKALGFRVANVPEYSPYAIAEHAVALMMALNRKIVQSDRKVKDYNFLVDDLIGFDMNGKTVGIIGTGKIGCIVGNIMHGFGCKLLGYDPYKNQELINRCDIEYVSLEKLCEQSDIITIHAPLNEHTRYMINKDNISMMKKGVMLINTGRGGVINTADVIDGLKAGRIGYLGLDVYEKEKGLFFKDHSGDIPEDDMFARLLTFKNVLITGHHAFLTETALTNIADTTFYNLNKWAKGEESENELYELYEKTMK